VVIKIVIRAGGKAQGAEHLPSKHKTLSKKPNTTKKKKRIIIPSKLKQNMTG
jgi:hypothetical protein